MGNWLGLRLTEAGPEPRCDRRLDRGPRRQTTVTRRELTIGGGHIGGQLGWIHVGLGAATGRRTSASSGRTASSGRGST